MNKKFLLTIFIFLSFITKSFSSEFIGVIGVAVGDIINQKNEKLINGSKVFFGDTIFVKSKSNAQILFLDETVMTVGDNTELTIDDFIYDPNTNDGNFVTNVKSGTVKFITGKISKKNPDNLEIKIPNGSLGVSVKTKNSFDPYLSVTSLRYSKSGSPSINKVSEEASNLKFLE